MEPTLTIRDLRFEPYIPAEKIHAAITALAERINRDYGTAHRPLLLVTLSGAVVFAGELFRQLDGPSGHVAVDVPPTADVRDRDVIVAEDVVDTGTTIHRLHTLLTQQGARSIRVATLLLKPAIYYHQPTRPNPLPIDYVALEAEPKFIVGYGMDYDEQGRNLGALYTLCEDK